MSQEPHCQGRACQNYHQQKHQHQGQHQHQNLHLCQRRYYDQLYLKGLMKSHQNQHYSFGLMWASSRIRPVGAAGCVVAAVELVERFFEIELVTAVGHLPSPNEQMRQNLGHTQDVGSLHNRCDCDHRHDPPSCGNEAEDGKLEIESIPPSKKLWRLHR